MYVGYTQPRRVLAIVIFHNSQRHRSLVVWKISERHMDYEVRTKIEVNMYYTSSLCKHNQDCFPSCSAGPYYQLRGYSEVADLADGMTDVSHSRETHPCTKHHF